MIKLLCRVGEFYLISEYNQPSYISHQPPLRVSFTTSPSVVGGAGDLTPPDTSMILLPQKMATQARLMSSSFAISDFFCLATDML